MQRFVCIPSANLVHLHTNNNQFKKIYTCTWSTICHNSYICAKLGFLSLRSTARPIKQRPALGRGQGNSSWTRKTARAFFTNRNLRALGPIYRDLHLNLPLKEGCVWPVLIDGKVHMILAIAYKWESGINPSADKALRLLEATAKTVHSDHCNLHNLAHVSINNPGTSGLRSSDGTKTGTSTKGVNLPAA